MSRADFKPRVSIVIPVYNGADYLSEAIDSALAQTYSNTEIVVVNDGSSDAGATEKIALSYGGKIRYFSKPNGGVASALNRAIRESTGEYISWLSHDDLYTPSKVEVQVRALSMLHQRTIVYSDAAAFTNSLSELTPLISPGVAPAQFRYWITMQSVLHGCSLLLPKSVFNECGCFDEKLKHTQDYDFWFRIAEAYRFVHVPGVLVYGRQHAKQDSRAMAIHALVECNILLSRFIETMTPAELTIGSGNSVAVTYANLAVGMWKRGFYTASRSGLKKTFKSFASSSTKEIAGALMTLAMGNPLYQIVKPVLRLLPSGLKTAIKAKLIAPRQSPTAAKVRHDFNLKEKFTDVYDRNLFEGAESRSGEGSNLVQTAVIREELPKLIEELQVQSFLDAPCGDWYWMRECDLKVKQYVGVDIVPTLIEQNQKKFGNDTTRFQCLDLASDNLPSAELVFSRDCLEHLSYADAIKVIQNIKRSGASYFVTTTFTNRDRNFDLNQSVWRPLNKQLPPFNFPNPVKLINEHCTEGEGHFTDKCLGVWKLEDIHVSNTNLASP